MTVQKMPWLVGISGRKRHGKNEVAKSLRREFAYVEDSFAAPLKVSVRAIYGWTTAHTDGDLKEIIDPRWGVSPRHVMSKFGTEAVRNTLGQHVWVRSLQLRVEREREINPNVLIAVTDVRFPNEADMIRESGGVVLRVVRPGMFIPPDEHESETALDGYAHFDGFVRNDGTLVDLHISTMRCLRSIMEDRR